MSKIWTEKTNPHMPPPPSPARLRIRGIFIGWLLICRLHCGIAVSLAHFNCFKIPETAVEESLIAVNVFYAPVQSAYFELPI